MSVPAFAEWQKRYAEHHVALFPVNIVDGDKRPAVRGYMKAGLRASEQLAIKFASASAFGFVCGRRNNITIVDMDDIDEAILREGEKLFGQSPLLWRTGGGKYAAAYRHNGEARRIRPIASLPIDILGGGFAVAPPSAGALRNYEIIRGTLADLDRLPIARIPAEIARQNTLVEKIGKGRRNVELFRYCNSVVAWCDDLDQLLDAARTWAADRLVDPLPDAEVIKTANSVWKFRGGRRRVMSRIIDPDQFRALAADPTVFGVFAFLTAENGADAQFMIADGLGAAMGWPTRTVPFARKRMIEVGVVERVGRQGKTGPYLYRWRIDAAEPAQQRLPAPDRPAEGGRRIT